MHGPLRPPDVHRVRNRAAHLQRRRLAPALPGGRARHRRPGAAGRHDRPRSAARTAQGRLAVEAGVRSGRGGDHTAAAPGSRPAMTAKASNPADVLALSSPRIALLEPPQTRRDDVQQRFQQFSTAARARLVRGPPAAGVTAAATSCSNRPPAPARSRQRPRSASTPADGGRLALNELTSTAGWPPPPGVPRRGGEPPRRRATSRTCLPDLRPSVVVMNPPFSRSAGSSKVARAGPTCATWRPRTERFGPADAWLSRSPRPAATQTRTAGGTRSRAASPRRTCSSPAPSRGGCTAAARHHVRDPPHCHREAGRE